MKLKIFKENGKDNSVHWHLPRFIETVNVIKTVELLRTFSPSHQGSAFTQSIDEIEVFVYYTPLTTNDEKESKDNETE